jgi:hypothetical protein
MKVSWRSAGALAVAALVAAGCGESGSGSDSSQDRRSSTEERSTREDPARIRFESAAVRADDVISPRFECGGGSVWLPLRWGAVPPDTEELVVYLGRFIPRKGADPRRLSVPFGIFITKIDPSIRGIPTNTLPPESSYVTYKPFNSCPQGRRGQNILLRLFALERPVYWRSLSSDAVIEFTESALGMGTSSPAVKWLAELSDQTLASSRIVATYGR